jgi:hypothetical protein
MGELWTILKSIWSSPIVKAILTTLLSVLKKQADDLLPKVMEKVKEAMALPLSNEEKFQKVLDDLKAMYPAVATNTLRTLIELAVMSLTGNKPTS